MARTACLVCFISTVNGGSKKGGKCLGRCGASSRHTTKLKQSIFFRYLWEYQGNIKKAGTNASGVAMLDTPVPIRNTEVRHRWAWIILG
jgi:hypothetical protein